MYTYIGRRFARGDNIYMRVEGVIFISCDTFLNFYFIKCVKRQLLDLGLEKYRPLMNFVIRIIFISVAIDVSILAFFLWPVVVSGSADIAIGQLI